MFARVTSQCILIWTFEYSRSSSRAGQGGCHSVCDSLDLNCHITEHVFLTGLIYSDEASFRRSGSSTFQLKLDFLDKSTHQNQG